MHRTEHNGAPDEEPSSSLGDIVRDLSKNALDLVRDEVQLAAAEMSRKVSKAGSDLQLMTIGASVTYAGFLLILAAAVIALSVFIPAGWAALAVGLATLIAGAITMRIGRRRLSRDNFIPSETIDTMKADTKWMRDQLM